MQQIPVTQVGGNALPHILEVQRQKEGAISKGVFDAGISQGDYIRDFPTNGHYTVVDVLESRPAKGDWSGKSYKGRTPTYYELRCAVNEPEPIKTK